MDYWALDKNARPIGSPPIVVSGTREQAEAEIKVHYPALFTDKVRPDERFHELAPFSHFKVAWVGLETDIGNGWRLVPRERKLYGR